MTIIPPPPRKKTQYNLVTAYDTCEMVNQVNEALSSGWSLYGSTFMTNKGAYAQPLIRTTCGDHS